MCAWSETSRGIVYYASRATGGRVVQFDALKSEVVCIVDVGTGRWVYLYFLFPFMFVWAVRD